MSPQEKGTEEIQGVIRSKWPVIGSLSKLPDSTYFIQSLCSLSISSLSSFFLHPSSHSPPSPSNSCLTTSHSHTCSHSLRFYKKHSVSEAMESQSSRTDKALCCAVLCLVAQCVRLLATLHGLEPASSSVHEDSPGKNTGVSCHDLLQAIFPTQESEPGLLHCGWILYHLSHQRSPLAIQ